MSGPKGPLRATIAERFINAFGTDAFAHGPDTGMAALQWLADNDPEGTGQLVADTLIYHFSDSSSLIYDRNTNRFTRPQ